MLQSSDMFLAVFQLCVAVIGSLTACLGALYYFRHVRLERPAIGRFNGRDVVILFAFLVLLPGLYLLVPQWLLTSLLVLTFVAALAIGYRPVLPPGVLWLGIGVLVGADLWMGQHMINNVFNWQFVWAENSIVVALAAIAVANLYVQGGMQLLHVTWFAAALALYDAIFTFAFPVSNLLLRAFVNHPLFPAVGMRIGFDEAVLGLGDLLVYGGFTIAALKAYGKPGLRLALSLILVFGAVLPSISGLIFDYVDVRLDVVIPAQTWFGPAAVVGYLWLRRRYGRERTVEEYLASVEVARRPAADPARPRVAVSTSTLGFAVADEDRPVLDELVQYFGNGNRSAYLRATLKVMRSVKVEELTRAEANGQRTLAQDLTADDVADVADVAGRATKGRS